MASTLSGRRVTATAALAAVSAAVSFSFSGHESNNNGADQLDHSHPSTDAKHQQHQPAWPLRLAEKLQTVASTAVPSSWKKNNNIALCESATPASKDLDRHHFAALLSDADKKCRADLAADNKGQNLKLVQAHVVFRHGARSAVWKSGLVAHVDWGPICAPVNTPPGLAGYTSGPGNPSDFDDIDMVTPAAAGTGPEDEARRRKVNSHLAHQFIGAHLHVVDDDGVSKRPISRVDQAQSSQLMPGGGCRLGQLTALGASQASQLGEQMAKRYQGLGLLHSEHTTTDATNDAGLNANPGSNPTSKRGAVEHANNHNHALDLGCDLVARSTNVARCVSTMSFALGKMLDVVRETRTTQQDKNTAETEEQNKNTKRKQKQKQEVSVVVHTRDHKVEYLTPNRHCNRMMRMMQIVKKQRTEQATEKELAVAALLVDIIPTDMLESSGVTDLNFILLRDLLKVVDAHGEPLPFNISRELFHTIEELGTDQMARYCQHRSDNWLASVKVGLGAFLGDVRDTMDAHVKAEADTLADVKQGVPHTPPRHLLSLVAAHDTTILPLLMSLHLFDGKWPTFCANIAFELYEDENAKDNNHKYFVRVLYDWEEKLVLPLKVFADYVDAVAPEDWQTECALRGKEGDDGKESTDAKHQMAEGGSNF